MSKQLRAILVGAAVALVIWLGISFALASAGAEPLSSAWTVALGIGTLTALGMMNMAGNKSVKVADSQTRAAALSLTPPPGTGLVIVFRDGFMAKANGIDISLDGRYATQLKSPQFTAISATPGRHAIKAIFSGPMNAGGKPGEADFDVAAGQTVVFQITLAMKMTTSDVIMTRVEEPAGAVRKLAKMKMVEAAA